MELSLVKCLKLIEDSSQISNMILVHRVYPVGTLCIFYSIIYIYVKEDAKHTTLSKHVLSLKRRNINDIFAWIAKSLSTYLHVYKKVLSYTNIVLHTYCRIIKNTNPKS